MKRPVIICTEHRGVFFGNTEKTSQDIVDSRTVDLTGAKMAIRFGTTKGVMELADTGPTGNSKAGAPADITLNAVTAVFEVTAGAAEKWDGA